MVVASACHHAGVGYTPIWMLHNSDAVTTIYFDIHQNVYTGPGTTSFHLPPGSTIVLDGSKTYWARTDSEYADLHLMPTGAFGMPGSGTPAVPTNASLPG